MEHLAEYGSGIQFMERECPCAVNIRQVSGDALQEGVMRRVAAELSSAIVVSLTGAPATAYLLSAIRRRAFPPARLVILDLQGPGSAAQSVLRTLRGDVPLHAAPVVVFYPAGSAIPIVGAEGCGVNSWIVKSLQPERVVEAVRRVCNYWLSLNEMPNQSSTGLPSAALHG